MTPITIVAIGALIVVLGGPLWILPVAGAITVAPALGWLVLAVLGSVVVIRRLRARTASSVSVSRFLRNVAAELASGRTLVQTLTVSDDARVDPTVRRLCAVGSDGATIADALAPGLGRHARTFGAAVALSEVSGGPLASTLEMVADQASIDEASERERRVATSQARFSALVVGVVPLAIALLVVALRGVPEPGGPLIVVPMVAGGALMVAGGGVVVWMSRSRRVR